MITASNRTSQFHYAIREVVGAADAVERSGKQVIRLNIGDPQAFGFRPPEHVIEPVQRALKDRFTGYAHSAGLPEARESIARYATDLGSPTVPDDVVITSGASEAADLVLSALLNPGDEVLFPSPGYPLYTAIANKLGAVPRNYHLSESDGWQPSADEISTQIGSRTKAIVLINPSNPTGAVTCDSTTARILELASEHDILVVSDEVYSELCFGVPPVSASMLAGGSGTAVITLESLSKTHMLSGWRIGWMRFTNADKMRDLSDAITRLASGRLCSPTPAQYAVRPALEGDKTFLNDFIGDIRRKRDFGVDRVNSIAGLSCLAPDAAFYLMLKVRDLYGQTDEQFTLEMLKQTGVLVVPGSGFGCNTGEGYFRLVYLADEHVLDAAFNEIERYIQPNSVAGRDPRTDGRQIPLNSA